MRAEDATEFMEREREADRFKRWAAVVISCFAVLLAITGLGGQNATKEATNSNIEASNLYSFYQAKNQRQNTLTLTADIVEGAFLNDPALPEAARASLRGKAEGYRRTAARYESEPETQEGKKELMARAKAAEARRDHALRQDPYFDYAEALLQIAIVLISVSLVTEVNWLAFMGGGLGAVGAVLMLNGFTLLVEVPFLS